MSWFKEFKNTVRAKGGIWASNDVYFSQLRDGYTAAYLPAYPQQSPKDEAIHSVGLKRIPNL